MGRSLQEYSVSWPNLQFGTEFCGLITSSTIVKQLLSVQTTMDRLRVERRRSSPRKGLRLVSPLVVGAARVHCCPVGQVHPSAVHSVQEDQQAPRPGRLVPGGPVHPSAVHIVQEDQRATRQGRLAAGLSTSSLRRRRSVSPSPHRAQCLYCAPSRPENIHYLSNKWTP